MIQPTRKRKKREREEIEREREREREERERERERWLYVKKIKDVNGSEFLTGEDGRTTTEKGKYLLIKATQFPPSLVLFQ